MSKTMTQNDVKNDNFLKSPAKSKKKNPRFVENLSEYFSDYCSNTSIQGVKYLGDKNRSIYEKLFWLILLSTSIYLCGYLINRVYHKWQNSPVIVTLSNNLIPVWKVPFPAVTICPENKNKKSVYDYTDALKKFSNEVDNMTEQELKHFEQMNFLCGDDSTPNGSKIIGNDTIDFIFKVAPTSDEWGCRWNYMNEVDQACNTLLTPVLTDDGVCFTFNMLDRKELFTSSVYNYKNFFKHGKKSTNWTLETGYSEDAGINVFPRRTSAGLSFTFNVGLLGYEPDIDYGCRGAVLGYKVLLHNPAEIPRMFQNCFLTSFDKQIAVGMKPEMMTTSEELGSYDPQERQCYYSYERHLKYFRVYTQSNCELECLTNHTLESCGCVSFYMPRETTTDICGRDSSICIINAERNMILREMKLKDLNYENATQEICNCLPSCTSLSYNAETSVVDHEWKKRFEARNDIDNMSDYSLTQIYFFFNVQYFITTERKELYGLTDFIANCGGFLGLFMGFSFLSMVEIIYFLSLRLICNVRTYGLHFWSGSPKVGFDSKILTSDKTCNTISNPPPANNNVAPKHRLTVVDVEWK